MPPPYDRIAVGDTAVDAEWTKVHTAVTNSVAGRVEVVTDTALVATKQAAYDAALAAWVAAESPPSGAEFDAKELAAGELATAQTVLAASTSALADLEADLMSKRKEFGRAVADYALILGEAPEYGPPTSPARLFDLIYQVAFGLAPTF